MSGRGWVVLVAETGETFRAFTDDGRLLLETEHNDGDGLQSADNRAVTASYLYRRTGYAGISDDSPLLERRERLHHVPMRVARAGKESMAAYLAAYAQATTEEIADALEVSDTTARQYVRNVRNATR